MKSLVARVFCVFIAFGGSAWSQSPTLRSRPATTVVTPNTTAPALPTTAPTTPAQGALKPKESVKELAPIPRLSRPGDTLENRPPHRLAIAPSLAAVYLPPYQQLEVFGIDPKGALKTVWKHHNGYWEAAFYLSGPGFAPAGAPLAAIWHPMNEQLEVFTLGLNGALHVTYKVRNGPWVAPSAITPPGFAPPGAHLAAVFQPLNNQLEVFAVDGNGAVTLAWKAQNGRWQGPVALTPPGIAPPGAPITAVWQPLNEQLEVFWVDTAGALRTVWKQHNARWAPQFNLTAPGFAQPRAKLAAVWQPLDEQLEVFAVDRAGGINVVWKAHNGRWNAPYVLGGPGIAIPGTDIVALWNSQTARLDVITVGTKNQLIQAWKINNGAWKPGPGAYSDVFAQTGLAGNWPLGAALSGVMQTMPDKVRREILTFDESLAVRALPGEGRHFPAQDSRITTENFGPIYGAHAAACSGVLRRWSRGYDGDTHEGGALEECIAFMGIAAHCERKNAYVTAGYPPQQQLPRYLQCTSKYEPDNVIEQFETIAIAVGKGLKEAAIATIVYSPEIAQGTACVNGVVFACASLAVSVGARVIELPPAIADAVDLASYASGCVNGDIVSCAKLGAAGARAVGVPIPGEDAGQIALLAEQCLNEDYAACLRLGERAAMAAGVPMGQIQQAAQDARNCYEGDVDACIALGRQAAKVGIPVGGVADGADNMLQCSYGSLADCQLLGQAIAAIPR